MHIFALLNVLVLVGLSSQCTQMFLKNDLVFPINAISVVRGEVVDPVTKQLSTISGLVRFQQLDCSSNVSISINIVGLPQTIARRGLHIHSFGISDSSSNVTAICGSVGPHFNPTNETHGFLESEIRHVGDLGNVESNIDGSITTVLTDDRISLYDQKYSIIGRSIVLHQLQDDGGLGNTDISMNFGSSGSRIACGTIGLDRTVEVSSKKVLLQVVSPSVEGLGDQLKASWVSDFIKSKLDFFKLQ